MTDAVEFLQQKNERINGLFEFVTHFKSSPTQFNELNVTPAKKITNFQAVRVHRIYVVISQNIL